MGDLKISLLGVFEIVSKGELPPPLVYAMSILLVCLGIRILFGLPLTPVLRAIGRALKHLKTGSARMPC